MIPLTPDLTHISSALYLRIFPADSGDATSGEGGSGIYLTTISVTDGTYTGSATIDWTISSPLTIQTIGAQQNLEGDSISLQVSASTQDNASLTYGASNLPPGLTIDPTTGLITGTIDAGDATGGNDGQGDYLVSISVSDGTYTETASFEWTVSPRITVQAADQSNTEGDSVFDCGAGPRRQFWCHTDQRRGGAAPGLTIDPTAGVISGTINAGDAAGGDGAGNYSITVTATDGTYSGSAMFQWHISPRITIQVANQQNMEGDPVNVSVQANNPDNTSLTYSASGLPSGLTIDSSTGVISGTIASGDATGGDGQGNYTVAVTASDGSYSTSSTFTWAISPRITIHVADQQNTEGDTVNVGVQASTPDNTTLSYSASGLPPGLTIDSSTGAISGTIDTGAATSGNDGPGVYSVTIRVTDGNYSASAVLTWTVSPLSTGNVIYSNTFAWNGTALVQETVTQQADGSELWDFKVTNESFVSGIANFAVPAEDASLVSSPGNNLGWSNSIGTFLSNSDLVSWSAGSGQTLGIVRRAISTSRRHWWT